MNELRAFSTAAIALSCMTVLGFAAHAQTKYDTGATENEIKIGNTMPYSGPVSAYSAIGKTEAAYFAKINDQGGVNGRKIVFISYDDAFSPPKTVEQTRRLVENDGVLLIFNALGTAPNTATQKYLNARQIPQLFVATGATKWNDPKHFPWTMGWQPNYQTEGRIYAGYLLKEYPNAKIGILFQNDDYGKDYVKGFKDGLKGKIQILAQMPFEVTDPTIESQIVTLKNSGADTFFNVSTPKFAAQAIKKVASIDWKPLQFLNLTASSIGAVLKPAGLENARGIISAQFLKDPNDPQWKEDVGYKDWIAFMNQYYPEGDKADGNVVYAYSVAQTLIQVLKQCGNDLTRQNVMRQAANLHDLQLEMLLPGIVVNTSPIDFAPIDQMRMVRFNGQTWSQFGPVIDSSETAGN